MRESTPAAATANTPSGPARQLLACAVGEMCAGIELGAVLAVLREPEHRIAAPSLDAHQYLMRFRGEILTAVDLPALYGGVQPSGHRRTVVVARVALEPVCLIVDRVYGIYRASHIPPARVNGGPTLVELAADGGAPEPTLVLIDEHLMARFGVSTAPTTACQAASVEVEAAIAPRESTDA